MRKEYGRSPEESALDPGEAPIPRQVTVVFDQELTITVVPYDVEIFRNNQRIEWTLVSQVPGIGWKLGSGIVIKKEGAEPPHSNWPGPQAAPCSNQPTMYCVDNSSPNMGTDVILYQYDINLAADMGLGDLIYSFRAGARGSDNRSEVMLSYDPDIPNEPHPP